MKNSSKLILALLVFVLGIGFEANAVTKTWVGTTGGSWATGANWSPVGVPNAGDDVIIGADQSASITAVPTISLNSLTINGTCTFEASVSPNTLTVTGTFTVAAGKIFTQGANFARLNFILSSTGTGTISGTVRINSGGAPRFFQNDGDLSITSSGVIDEIGNGTFILSSGATLRVGSTAGITTAGATGNIQTTTRTYTSGANYVYNGTANQAVGNGLTQNTPATLTINNPGNTVSLGAATSISGALTILSGTLNANGQTSTIAGLTTINGTYLASTATQTFNGGLAISGGTFTGSSGDVITTDVTLSSGVLTAPSGSFNVSGNWAKSGGTFTPGSNMVTFTKGAGTQTLNSGGSSFNAISHTGAGTLQLFTNSLATGGTFSNSTGSFDANGLSHTVTNLATVSSGSYLASTATQTFNGGLTISGGTVTGSSGGIAVNGNLSIGNSSTLTVANASLTVTGATVVGGGTSGSLIFGSTTGVKTFGGLLTLASSSTWNNAVNSNVTFQGGISRGAGTFTVGSGVYTFDTNSQSLTGTYTIPNVTVTGITLTNNNTLTVSTALSGTGSLTQVTGSTLTILGTSSIATLNASNSGNVVIFNGPTQTVNASTYHNLTINETGGTNASLGGAAQVNGTLTLTVGNLNIGSNTLTIGSSATISGASSTTMILASGGGELKKTYSGASSFIFPVGDNTGATEYSPITINATAGGFPVDLGVSLVDAKHPNNASVTNFLSRYWNVSSTAGITATVTGTYLPADINGVEASISSAQLNGVFNQTTNPWTKFVALGANTLTTTGAVFTAGQTSAFTGITGANPSVSITGGGVTICTGSSVPLTVSVVGGDPSIIYSWSPVTGLSSATISNPAASPTTTTPYTVSIRDGNGILATSAASTITVDQAPTISNAGPNQTLCVTSTTLSGNNPIAVGTGAWSFAPSNVGTGGSIVTPANFNSTFTGTAGQTYILRWTISNGVCTASTSDVQIRFDAAPTSSVSAGNQTICGTSATLNGTLPIIGVGQWSFAPGGNPDGLGVIADVNSRVSGFSGTAGQSYILRWTISNGTCTSSSSDATINFSQAPVAANANVDITLCNTSSFTMAANSPSVGTGNWSYVSGFAGITITTPSSPFTTITGLPAGNTVSLRWTITNGACGSFDDVILTNNVAPFVNIPSNQVLCANTSTALVTFSGNASVYSWTNDTPSIGLPASGVGDIAPFTALNPAGVPVIATLVITPSTGICTGATQSFTITVNPIPVINPISNISSGTGVLVGPIPVSTNVVAGGETFTWSGGAVVGLPDGSGLSPIPAFTTINAGVTPISNLVSVVAVKNGCSGPTSNFSITVYPIPGALAGDQNICTGDFSSVLITSNVVGTTFTWTIGTVTGTVIGQAPGSGSVIAQQLFSVAGGIVQYIITPTAFGIPGPPAFVSVGVLPTPLGNAVPTGTYKFCSGTSLNITPTSSVASSTFTWTGSNGSGGSGNITDAPINATSNPMDITYTVIPTGPGTTFCAGSPFTIVVTVDPIPVITNPILTQTICGSGLANFTPIINVASSTYSWTSTVLSGAASGVTASGTTPVNDNLNNVGSVAAVVRYRVTPTGPTSSFCVGNFVDYVVTVNPIPNALASGQSMCSGSTSNIVITNPNAVTGTTFSWTLGTVTGTVIGQSVGSGTVISQTLTSVAGGSVAYIITPSANGCPGTPLAPIIVTVDPIPVGNNVASGANIICSGTSLNIIPTLSVGTGTFTWSGSNGSGGIGNITDAPINTTSIPIDITYTVIPTGPGITFCAGSPFTIVVTVDPIPVITNPTLTQTICGSGVASFTPIINVASSTYSWTSTVLSGAAIGVTASGSTAVNDNLNNAGSVPAVVRYRVTPTGPAASLCAGNFVDYVVTVNPIPNALASGQSMCSGSTSNIVITNPNTVTGTTFSWTLGTVTGTVSGQSAGSGTTISQTLTSLAGGSVEYFITPSANGCPGTPLAPVIVTVDPIPVGNSVASGTNIICSGTSLNIVPTLAIGVAGSYTWTGSNGSGGSGNITDAPINATSNPMDITYTVIPTGPGTTFCAGSPFTIVVTVDPIPVITNPILTQTICGSGLANFTPIINVASSTYSWTSTVLSGAASGVTAVGSTAVNDNLNNTGSVPAVVRYRVTPTGPATSLCVGNFVDYVVTVNPLPDASANPQNICSGSLSNVVITNPNGVAGTTFSWIVQSALNVSGQSAGSGSVIGQLLTSVDGINPGSVTYRITPSSNGCSGAFTDVVITVGSKPVITNSPTSLIQDVCSGTTLNFIPTSTIGGTQFDWTSNVIPFGSLTGVSPTGSGVINDTPLNATSSTSIIIYTITPSIGLCSGNPVSVVVSVRPVPTVFAAGQIICSGSATSITITNPNTVTGTTFAWVVTSSTNATGATAGTGTVISQVLTSTDGLTNGTVDYTITPYANGCAGLPITVTVTVEPVPLLSNPPTDFSQQICSNVPLNFIPTSLIGAATFSWTSTIIGTINPGSVTASGSGPITDTPIDTGNTSGTVRYTITPSLNSCNGLPIDLIVTVKPLPSATGSDVIICSGQNAIINILPTPVNVSGTTFSWIATPSANVVGSANGNGSTINQVLSTNDSLLGTVAYSITPAANGCNALLPTIVTATINPIATVNAGVDFRICETLSFPAPMTIPISGTIGGSATVGTWTRVSGTGSISPSVTSPGGIVTATYTVGAGDIAGQVTLRLTTNDPDFLPGPDGPCINVFDDLIINVDKRARVASLPANYQVCESTTPINLTGTLSGSATSGIWSLVSGNGTLSASSVTGMNVNASYDTATTDVNTTLIFRLKTNDPIGSCTIDSVDVNVYVNEPAKVDAGSDFEVCEYDIVNLVGSYSGATTGVTWTSITAGPSAFGNVNDTITTYTLTPADIFAGGVTLMLTSNNPGLPCNVVTDQVFVKVNLRPQPIIVGLAASYAENDPPDNLFGFPATGSSFLGTFTGPGIVAGTNTFVPSPLIIGFDTIVYNVINTITGCSGDTSQVTVVNPATSVTFGILSVGQTNPDYSPAPIICNTNGKARLIGLPAASPPLTTASFSSPTPTILGSDASGQFVNTQGLISGNYVVTYTYKNELGVTSFSTKTVVVLATPRAIIGAVPSCVTDSVTFTDLSVFLPGDNAAYPGVINGWDWDFEGINIPTTRTIQNPKVMYNSAGLYGVTLKVISTYQDQICSADTLFQITIGPVPTVDFTWSKICLTQATEFKDNSTAGATSTIVGYSWDFDDGVTVPTGSAGSPISPPVLNTSNTYSEPHHKYGAFKEYQVTHTVTTDVGCKDSIQKRVYIQDYEALTSSQSYFENFENGKRSWVNTTSSKDTIYSWVFGPPIGNEINSAKSGVNAWWTGANQNFATDLRTYYLNDSTEVTGPCLNLSAIKRPMISLNYWSDAQSGFDGAVVQYLSNGSSIWETIGDANGKGIEWYNGTNLGGNPGGQDNFGWTGSTGGWKNARFNLEQIPVAQRDTVVFRIAFGSNNTKLLSGDTLNGFAFDDIYIGEKTRNILIENFTNDADPSQSITDANTYLDNLYQQDFALNGRDSSDFNTLQYHIASSAGTDAIYDANPIDPGARRLFYGVSQPPVSIMDGILGMYYGTDFNGTTDLITPKTIDQRSLEDPRFDIGIQFNTSADSVLDLNLSYTYIDTLATLNTPVILHAALVETDATLNTNAMLKLLLQGEGRFVDKTWIVGVPLNIPVTYTIDVPVVDPDQLSIIAFVQDKNSGKILQSIIQKVVNKRSGIVTGISDDATTAEIAGLNMYPNPVSKSLFLQIDEVLSHDYAWKMIDQRGIVVLSGDLNRDLSTPQSVDISLLADGIYIMAIQSGDRNVVYRKIAVMKRN